MIVDSLRHHQPHVIAIPLGDGGQEGFSWASELLTRNHVTFIRSGSSQVRLLHTPDGDVVDNDARFPWRVWRHRHRLTVPYSIKIVRVRPGRNTGTDETQELLMSKGLARSRTSHPLTSEDDPASSAKARSGVIPPENSRCNKVMILALEKIVNDSGANEEFDGHFADDPQFQLRIGPAMSETIPGRSA